MGCQNQPKAHEIDYLTSKTCVPCFNSTTRIDYFSGTIIGKRGFRKQECCETWGNKTNVGCHTNPTIDMNMHIAYKFCQIATVKVRFEVDKIVTRNGGFELWPFKNYSVT